MGTRQLALTMPSTRAEALALGALRYDGGRPCKYGHVVGRYANSSKCCQCTVERVTRWQRENREWMRTINANRYRKNRDEIIANAKRWVRENPEKRRTICARWVRENPEKRRAACAKYRIENQDTERARAAKWARENPDKKRAQCMNYIARKLMRTPVWADMSEIALVYKRCPTGMHVDHIVPLRGKMVSGLHVPHNLQYLPAIENVRKSNTFVAG